MYLWHNNDEPVTWINYLRPSKRKCQFFSLWKGLCKDTQTHTDTHRHTQTDRQTDRQTGSSPFERRIGTTFSRAQCFTPPTHHCWEIPRRGKKGNKVRWVAAWRGKWRKRGGEKNAHRAETFRENRWVDMRGEGKETRQEKERKTEERGRGGGDWHSGERRKRSVCLRHICSGGELPDSHQTPAEWQSPLPSLSWLSYHSFYSSCFLDSKHFVCISQPILRPWNLRCTVASHLAIHLSWGGIWATWRCQVKYHVTAVNKQLWPNRCSVRNVNRVQSRSTSRKFTVNSWRSVKAGEKRNV